MLRVRRRRKEGVVTEIVQFVVVPFDFAGDGADLLAIFVQRLLHLIDETVEFVPRFDLFPLSCVIGRMGIGIALSASVTSG